MGVRDLARPLLFGALFPAALAAQSPDYILTLGSAAGSSADPVSIHSTIDNNGLNIQGWSLGACNDPAAVTPIAIDLAETATILYGGLPAFYLQQLFAGGWTQGVVIDLGMGVLPAGTQGFVHAIAEYQISPAAATGSSVSLDYCNTLGSPLVATVVVVGGSSIAPTQVSGSIEILPPPPAFIRGDANADGSVNHADAIWLLGELFLPGAPLTDCELADDANDDGLRDIADAIYLLNLLFGAGPPPAAPFPECGAVPGTQPPDCARSDCP